MNLRSNRGIILIATYSMMAVLFVLGGAYVSRSVAENRAAQSQRYTFESFYLAEAGIDRAIVELRNDFNWAGAAGVVLGNGNYTVNVERPDNISRRIVSTGTTTTIQPTPQRMLEVFVVDEAYVNALYVAEDIDVKGKAHYVTGDVRYGGELKTSGKVEFNVDGEVVQDPTIDPLFQLDFAGLKALSQAQGNYYDEDRLDEVKKGKDSFPETFTDPITGDVNVVYVEGKLDVGGNTDIGGFYVVEGDVDLRGDVDLDGIIYTNEEVELRGTVDVNGGVWAQEEAELDGTSDVSLNSEYMDALAGLGLIPGGEKLVRSWREL